MINPLSIKLYVKYLYFSFSKYTKHETIFNNYKAETERYYTRSDIFVKYSLACDGFSEEGNV